MPRPERGTSQARSSPKSNRPARELRSNVLATRCGPGRPALRSFHLRYVTVSPGVCTYSGGFLYEIEHHLIAFVEIAELNLKISRLVRLAVANHQSGLNHPIPCPNVK